jgi:hypothetical protein
LSVFSQAKQGYRKLLIRIIHKIDDMSSLIFITSSITVFILLIRLIIVLIKHKSIAATLRLIAIIVFGYAFIWIIFYFKSTEIAVPFGTNVCFDDWCATITHADRPKTLGQRNPQGQFIVLHIKMSNHAKGIAQKPSEPRVHILDGQGHSWVFSKDGQQALENAEGKQIPIDVKLELNQSLETQLVFDIPRDAKNIKAIVNEGPFITKLLLRNDSEVFVLH